MNPLVLIGVKEGGLELFKTWLSRRSMITLWFLFALFGALDFFIPVDPVPWLDEMILGPFFIGVIWESIRRYRSRGEMTEESE